MAKLAYDVLIILLLYGRMNECTTQIYQYAQFSSVFNESFFKKQNLKKENLSTNMNKRFR